MIDRAGGEIHYSVSLLDPIDAHDARLIDVVWRALRPAENLQVSLWSDRYESRAYLGLKLLTENEFGPRGALSGSRASFPRAIVMHRACA